MKIAQIAPIGERVPPKKYGGIERIVHTLTEELVKKGHDVTLFASGDSKTSARLGSIYPRALREAKIRGPYGLNEWLLLHLGAVYKIQKSFDIIHDHNSIFSVPIAQFAKTPVVITLHGLISPVRRRLFETFQNPNYVSISKSQVENFPKIKTVGYVYNGLNMDGYPFGEKRGDYLLVVGRICMDKGTHLAIEVALDLNIPLIIAAKLDYTDINYFREYVEPRLFEEQIKWIGEVDEEERNQLMSNAMCLLHPVTWNEPFGLNMIEAMACGTPVVAFNRGSIPEVIEDGKTGYIVDDLEEMILAVTKINKIDRAYCRQYALKNFNAQQMTEGYEKIYKKILSKV